jgi:phage repressor protein C with HTH and peptisase S24 domain
MGIREEWIETGEGSMRLDEMCVREERGEYKVFTKPPSCGGLLPDHFVLIGFVESPLGAGSKAIIANSSPYQLLAFRNDWISEVASSPENLILLPVKGPSMEKTIFDGDLVMVDTSHKEIIRDLIYAVRIEETLTIKRVQKLPDGRYRLISDNKDFPPEDFSPEEAKIAGRVIWLARDHIK